CSAAGLRIGDDARSTGEDLFSGIECIRHHHATIGNLEFSYRTIVRTIPHLENRDQAVELRAQLDMAQQDDVIGKGRYTVDRDLDARAHQVGGLEGEQRGDAAAAEL